MSLFVPRLGNGKIQSVVEPASNINQKFYELPTPTGSAPYHLSLDEIIPVDGIKEGITFHMVGDTGGTKALDPTHVVADALEFDCAKHNTSFMFHLGDVVYSFGQAEDYNPEFYDPYQHYPGPIFAIPGNKDGDVKPGSNVPSLAAFMTNFCAKEQRVTPDAGDINRWPMAQPNCFWTLDAPFVTIIGLYSNVPDGGVIKQNQIDWFVSELKNAPKDKALIVAVHHATFSADSERSGSDIMLKVLDNAFKESKRLPDMICSGHVHNYQRFSRQLDNREIPYLVIGTGGKTKLHKMQKHDNEIIQVPSKLPDRDDVVLENYCDDRFGFMRFNVTANKISGKFFCVAAPHKLDVIEHEKFDDFTLDLKKHKLV